MNSITRRSFLRSAALTGATILSRPAISWGAGSGANDTIGVGVVGFGGRGGDHISGMRALSGKGVRLVALCDVDRRILSAGVESCAKKNEKVEGYTDIRELLENHEVDVVTIATPNHWHALATIWACQAGKDVYVEKPVSHNVWEGRQAVAAARKYKRIVQAGTQSRSSYGIREAVAWVRAGNLGKIRVARGLCYKRRPSIGKSQGPQPVPDTVDYDLWCGPAPLRPPRRNSKNGTVHYDWHWFWDYGNGDLGNQGIHQMDLARWFLGVQELSPAVLSFGGRLGYEDDGETPNTQVVFHGYPGAPLIFEVRGLPEKTGSNNMDKFPTERGGSVAAVIHCEGGYVLVPNYNSAVAYDASGREIKKWSGADDHYANFIQAVRSRRASDLNGDILEGHISSALCHTGNISYRLGRTTTPADIRSALRNEPEALESFERMVEHLAANDVDLARTPATLGPWLKMNPKKEVFKGNAQADALLTREYRAPFVVPKKV